LVEYLSFGMPVLVTDIAPHRIVPADAPFAFWAGRGDPEQLASAMLAARAVAADLPRLGREARTWAAPRLGWSAQLAILEEVLERAVAARSRVGAAR
jgi:glycosyltransferase involved in cell wall biosynthesis